MNLYFLVEGRRTEKKIYPKWLKCLLPNIQRVSSPDKAYQDNYFIQSGMGYPSILGDFLKNSIRDIENYKSFNYLIVIVDSDEMSYQEAVAEVERAIDKCDVKLTSAKSIIIIQHRCIETWLLGNRKIFSRNPENERLREYISHYNVCDFDPEAMELHNDFSTQAPFHLKYLKLLFAEKKLKYGKNFPGHSCDESYLYQLIHRIKDEPDHLQSFASFLRFCEMVYSLDKNT